jgi:hypothetical protein
MSLGIRSTDSRQLASRRFGAGAGLGLFMMLDVAPFYAVAIGVWRAASDVAAMPAGTHVILDQTRQAVERRARAILTQLQELGEDPVAKAVKE